MASAISPPLLPPRPSAEKKSPAPPLPPRPMIQPIDSANLEKGGLAAPTLPPRSMIQDAAMIEDYVYAPIDSDNAEIRLLKIHYDVNVFLRRVDLPSITASLKTCFLPVPGLSRAHTLLRCARLPVYEALSYVWGDEHKSHEIIVDGKSIAITKNLYAALRDIQADAVGSKFIWVDAICINQLDLQERSAQILLMKQIYHSACWVKIWLGSATEDGRRCLRFIERSTSSFLESSDPDSGNDEAEETLYDNKTVQSIVKAWFVLGGVVVTGGYALGNAVGQIEELVGNSIMQDDKQEILLDRVGNLSLRDDAIDSLNNWKMPKRYWKLIQHENFKEIAGLISKTFLEDCEWFSRMWVVQEMGVASSCEILYDGVGIPMSHFLRSIFYLHYKLDAPVPHIRKLIGMEKIRMGWNEGKRQALLDLIIGCRHRKATDPRDKIFSLIGIMGDQMNEFLKPDYTKAVGEVYANATFHFIIQANSLAPICGWQTLDRNKDIPSWTPDYSLNQDSSPSRLISEDGCEYNASGHDHRSRFDFKLNPESGAWSFLPTSGLNIGSLSVISSTSIEGRPFSETEELWHASIIAAGSLLRGLTPEVISCLDEISTLVKMYSKLWEARQKSLPSVSSNLTRYLNSTDILSKAIKPKNKTTTSTLGSLLHKSNIIAAYFQTLLCGRFSPQERLTDANIELMIDLEQEQLSAADTECLQQSIPEAFNFGIRRRKLGIINDGHIGAMPEQAQLGDLVCVLFGCSVPVVLRNREDGGYTFIGECYLNGFMDGEAIALQVKGQIKKEQFLLI